MAFTLQARARGPGQPPTRGRFAASREPHGTPATRSHSAANDLSDFSGAASKRTWTVTLCRCLWSSPATRLEGRAADEAVSR